ncbi:hypothetical protein COCON_G00113020 [Conger conger]|uniref:Uncharacterized protein n=1 Tax=Conger conger TaxID=82655 RepID=A0A9Q1HZN2_CONCO|nr:hypothetical protein COCON_G00113020 [Conger conger]
MLAKGHDFGAEACDNKFRQLKHRYKTIVDNKKKTGSGASSWVIFSSMEDLLADDPSVEPVQTVSSFAGSSSDPDGPGPSSSQPSTSQPKPSAERGRKRKYKSTSEAPQWLSSMSLSRGGRCRNSWSCKNKQWKWRVKGMTS